MTTSQIHRRKPTGKPMPPATSRANGKKSSIRARVERVFAQQKNRFGLSIRTIGLKRAEAKLTLANFAYNMDRLVFHARHKTAGWVHPKTTKKHLNQNQNTPIRTKNCALKTRHYQTIPK